MTARGGVCDIDAIGSEWSALADRTLAPPFFHPDWVRAWWRAFGSGPIEVAYVARAGELVAVLPLHRPAWRSPAYKTEPLPLGARPGTLRSPANWHVPEFGPVAEDSTAVADLFETVFGLRPNVLALACLSGASPSTEELQRAARRAGYRVVRQPLPPSPYIDVAGTWDDFRNGLPTRSVAELRRRRRRLGDEGAVRLDVQTGGESLHQALEEGFFLEASGWKAQRGSAITSRSATRRFYEEVSEWASSMGWLRLAFLRVGPRAVAFQLGLEAHGSYYFLKGGYDPALRRFAPGKLLAEDMIARAFHDGLRRFHFLGGDEAWKLEWTRTCRDRIVVHAFSPTIAGAVEQGILQWGRPFRSRVKSALRRFEPPRPGRTAGRRS